jgi:hypothetical protein
MRDSLGFFSTREISSMEYLLQNLVRTHMVLCALLLFTSSYKMPITCGTLPLVVVTVAVAAL